MVDLRWRWLGGFVVVMTLFSGSVGAQTLAPVSEGLQNTLNADENLVGFHDTSREDPAIASTLFGSSTQVPQGPNEKRWSRGQKMALAAGIGGAAGVLLGEFVFGQKLDFPHGPDMLIGVGLGAGLGAFIAWVVSGKESDPSKSRSGVFVVPVLSSSRKSLLVTLPLK